MARAYRTAVSWGWLSGPSGGTGPVSPGDQRDHRGPAGGCTDSSEKSNLGAGKRLGPPAEGGHHHPDGKCSSRAKAATCSGWLLMRRTGQATRIANGRPNATATGKPYYKAVPVEIPVIGLVEILRPDPGPSCQWPPARMSAHAPSGSGCCQVNPASCGVAGRTHRLLRTSVRTPACRQGPAGSRRPRASRRWPQCLPRGRCPSPGSERTNRPSRPDGARTTLRQPAGSPMTPDAPVHWKRRKSEAPPRSRGRFTAPHGLGCPPVRAVVGPGLRVRLISAFVLRRRGPHPPAFENQGQDTDLPARFNCCRTRRGRWRRGGRGDSRGPGLMKPVRRPVHAGPRPGCRRWP